MDNVMRWCGSVHYSWISTWNRNSTLVHFPAYSWVTVAKSMYTLSIRPVAEPPKWRRTKIQQEPHPDPKLYWKMFWSVKHRFRFIVRGMYGDIETARKTIVASAVLHNIAMDMREDLFPGEVLSNQLLLTQPSIPELSVVQLYAANKEEGVCRNSVHIINLR